MIKLPKKQYQAFLKTLESMSRIFRGPDDRFCESVQNGSFLSPFETLSPWITFTPSGILDRIRNVFDQYKDVPAFCNDLEETYVSHFINTRGGITAPLYQSCYEYDDAPLMGAAANEMRKRFESKGLSLAEDMNELPDHLSIELEYLYFLLETGWVEKNRGLMDEAAIFAADTLIPWLTQFSDKLDQKTPDGFYTLITSLLISILRFIASSENPASQ